MQPGFAWSLVCLCVSAISLQAQWKQTSRISGTSYQYVTSMTVIDNRLMAGTLGAGVYFSTSSGTKWSAVNSGMANLDVSTVITYDQKLFAGTANGIYTSADRGGTWALSMAGVSSTIVKVLASSSTQLYAATDGALYRSEDRGAHWSACLNDASTVSADVLSAYGERVMIGRTDGTLLLSTNNATSWASVGTSLPDGPVSALCVTHSCLMVAKENSGLFASVDNGQTWKDVSSGLPAITKSSLIVIGENVFLSTDQQGLWLSTDQGQNWKDIGDGMNKTLVTAGALFGQTLIVACNDGTCWKREISEMISGPVSVPSDRPDASQMEELTLYPNPASQSVEVAFPGTTMRDIHVSLSDLYGNILLSTDVTLLEPQSRCTVPLQHLSSGVYTLQAVAKGQRSTSLLHVIH